LSTPRIPDADGEAPFGRDDQVARVTWHLEFLVCSSQNGTRAFGVSSRSQLCHVWPCSPLLRCERNQARLLDPAASTNPELRVELERLCSARGTESLHDSSLEGTGFEISVPRETGVRGRLTRSATVAIGSVAALANRSRCPTPAITQRLRQTRWWRSTSLPTLGPAPKRRCQSYSALSLPAACGRRAAHPGADILAVSAAGAWNRVTDPGKCQKSRGARRCPVRQGFPAARVNSAARAGYRKVMLEKTGRFVR
jgi:hypothetical protein